MCDYLWYQTSTPPRNGKVTPKKVALVGVYRGTIVVVRKVNKRSIDLNRTILKELNTVS
jgi:hypothetical protein